MPSLRRIRRSTGVVSRRINRFGAAGGVRRRRRAPSNHCKGSTHGIPLTRPAKMRTLSGTGWHYLWHCGLCVRSPPRRRSRNPAAGARPRRAGAGSHGSPPAQHRERWRPGDCPRVPEPRKRSGPRSPARFPRPRRKSATRPRDYVPMMAKPRWAVARL